MTLILGRKTGMTQVFTEDGTHIGVTVVSAGPCVVTQVRTPEKDGYHAVQLGYCDTTDKRTKKPQRGHFQRAGTAPKRFLREERLAGPAERAVGETITVGVFAAGDLVDVTGTSKGRGFAGTIKRHHFSRGPKTHGCMNYRQPGSIGTKRTGKLFPGKRMSGHFGAARQTTKNLEVVRVDPGRNLLFLKGSIPGPTGGFVQVRTARTGVKKGAAAKG
ncbi:MAG: 50S ribosomal protein L3 [Planctomycetota bacterium]